MSITLHDRTADTVAVYFKKAQHPTICRMLPQKARTLDEALADFARTQLPGATSFGRTIHAGGRYVGDVWVYAIDLADTPNAMLSYCIFDPDMWRKGAATEGVRLFLDEVRGKFGLQTIGAFACVENAASIRVLERNGFALMEEFTEDGVISRYYERRFT